MTTPHPRNPRGHPQLHYVRPSSGEPPSLPPSRRLPPDPPNFDQHNAASNHPLIRRREAPRRHPAAYHSAIQSRMHLRLLEPVAESDADDDDSSAIGGSSSSGSERSRHSRGSSLSSERQTSLWSPSGPPPTPPLPSWARPFGELPPLPPPPRKRLPPPPRPLTPESREMLQRFPRPSNRDKRDEAPLRLSRESAERRNARRNARRNEDPVHERLSRRHGSDGSDADEPTARRHDRRTSGTSDDASPPERHHNVLEHSSPASSADESDPEARADWEELLGLEEAHRQRAARTKRHWRGRRTDDEAARRKSKRRDRGKEKERRSGQHPTLRTDKRERRPCSWFLQDGAHQCILGGLVVLIVALVAGGITVGVLASRGGFSTTS